MKLYIDRRDGMIRVQVKVNSRPNKGVTFRTIREAKDTPKNFKDILRWADAVGHTIEERRSE